MIRRRAWLGSRALDYVLSLPWAAKGQVCITGHSRNGKQSLIAAAFDERITAVADSSSGSPAGSPYRLTSAFTYAEDPFGGWPSCDRTAANHCDCSCDLSNLTHPAYATRPLPTGGGADPRCCWWKPSIVLYEGRENEAPIDSHGLYALIAPRHVIGEHAMTDGCDPTFAVEGAYVAGREAYRFLNASDHIRIEWRPGQHHGFESLDRYFDFFDIAFGRVDGASFPPLSIASSFPEVLLHSFDWAGWNASVGGPAAATPPPAGATNATAALEWLLGIAPSAGPGWSPGGEYGLLDWDYIQPMLGRSASGTPEKQLLADGVTQIALNFGEYTYAQMWWVEDDDGGPANVTGKPAVIWLHPYAYQDGYTVNYGQGSPNVLTEIAKAGHVVIAFDQVGFGLRQQQGTSFYSRYPLWSKLGRMVRDVSSAIDVLLSPQNNFSYATHPDGLPITPFMGVRFPAIDPKRIFAAGYSLGGMVALHAAALDARLAGAASIAGISPLRAQDMVLQTGGNAVLSHWHSLLPRLGWYEGSEQEIPLDYDDVIAATLKPTLVVAPEGDRMADHKALLALLARARSKLGPSGHLLTLATTKYAPPTPGGQGIVMPAQGINRLCNQHQALLLEWLHNQTATSRS